jgi:polysaccharide export outer membrane protein
LQPSESLVINEEGLVPYNIPVYRITKNDILNLNIVTTPKGDAAQFYSSYNTSGG